MTIASSLNFGVDSLSGSPLGGTLNVVGRDVNGNAAFNNVFADFTGHAAVGTITLTASSSGVHTFSSGSGTATVVLPDATTLLNGWQYFFNNNASGVITVQTNGGSTLFTMNAGSAANLYLISNGFSAGQWDYHWFLPTTAVYGTSGLTVTGTLEASGVGSFGTTTPAASAVLTLSSTTQGFLPPSMTTTQKNAISSPASGLTVYDSTLNDLQFYNGSSWLSGSGVLSVAGTSNQITASTSAGAVTLSLPNGVSLGSYQSTSPPTGGLILPGAIGIGVTSPAGAFQVNETVTAGSYVSFSGNATLTGSSPGYFLISGAITGPSGVSAMRIVPSIIANVSPDTTANMLYIKGTWNTTNDAITSAYSLYIDAASATGSHNVTNCYGLYVVAPTAGTSKTLGAVIFGHLSVDTSSGGNGIDLATAMAIGGSYAGVVAAPTEGLIVQGQAGFGTPTPNANCSMEIDSVTAYNLLLGGTLAAVDGGNNQVGLYGDMTFSPTTGSNLSVGISSQPSFASVAATTITTAPCFYSYLNYTGNAGTITNAIGFLASAGGSGAGTVTNAYGAYFTQQIGGTNNIALYADNLAVGYTGVTPPTNGAIIEGSVAIGSNAATTSALLAVSSTTKGFLPPSMTTTQKNAISSPAGGLVVYDSTLTDLQFYNGSAWVSGSGVTTITGTTHQIIAMPSTGSVTLSTPQNIDTSSNVQFATMGIGTTPGSGQALILESGSTVQNVLFIGGTYGNQASNPTAIWINPTITPQTDTALFTMDVQPHVTLPSGFNAIYNIYSDATLTGGGGSVEDYYGIYVTNPSVSGPTVTNMYGGYFNKPTSGSSINIALYSDNLSVNTTTSVSTANIGGSISYKVTTTAVSYNASTTDYIIMVTDTSTSRTITLPAASASTGRLYIVKDGTGGAGPGNAIVLSPSGGNIDGASTFSITVGYGSASAYSDGTNWYVI